MKKVLYVEDSVTSQMLMRRYLSGVCELLTASDRKTGATMLREQTFDLLIADFLFPDGDTTNLIHQVRRTEATKDMPVIVVSSSMDEALVDRVLKAGANDAMRKPLDACQIRTLVERMLAAPYRRKTEGGITGVNCFQWATKDAVFQFCQELDLTLSAPTEEEVSRRMIAALTERVAQGAALGFTYQETVITHTLRR